MMRKFSFAVLILSFFISFPTFAAASGGAGTEDLPDRSVYAKGCLPDPYYHAHAVPYREDPLPGILSLSFGSIRGFDVPRPLPPSSMLESITPVRDQGSLGSCTAFAVVAALECLVPGVSFSETELYIRAKTIGKETRLKAGCSLGSYIPLLREGAVERDYFSYEDYLEYVKIRKKMHSEGRISSLDNVLTCSPDYKASIEDFYCWRTRSGKSHPVYPKPRWREETYTVRERLPGMTEPIGASLSRSFLGGLIRLHPMASSIEEATTRETSRTRTVIDPDSYHPQKFHMSPIKIIASGLSKDPLYYLKSALRDKKPLVMSVMTFVEKDSDDNVTTDYWGADYLETKHWIIEFPLTRTKIKDGRHAVCLCGYDDDLKAFRLKNSWIDPKTGKPWADNGFAWISYEYILNDEVKAEIYVIQKR